MYNFHWDSNPDPLFQILTLFYLSYHSYPNITGSGQDWKSGFVQGGKKFVAPILNETEKSIPTFQT